ncbi:Sodium-dependent proline transporter [Armadillidium nasatum]|uniref:Sodium-dependent proline transporter n=1 Tax=Armadillidium nasatum TaxID=96803 RepID=A0A5N5SQD6_9CRUS|nr:Sodium-dependent proline transporter [Armadillidium nasatum]
MQVNIKFKFFNTALKFLILDQGVGLAMVVLSTITAVYNSQVVAYAVHYFFASFVNMDKTVLWGECKFFWPKCYDVKSNDICSFLNVTSEVPLHPRKCYEYMISSSRYYWQEQVLRLQELSDVGRIGKIHWDLTLCVAFIWLATFIFLAKGIKSSGKISLFTGFVPICILVTIMVYSVLEDGAYTGIKQFYQPDWDVLAKSEVWQKAAEQAIFSLCITYGSILTFSSYKRFRTELGPFYSSLEIFIPLFSSTGLYIHNIIGSAIIGPNVLLITLIEIVSLQCFYGVRRFSRDLNFILEREPSMYWKVCWIFVAPVTILEPVFQPSSSWGPGCPAIREMIVERRRKRLIDSESKRKLDGNENEAFASNAE